MKCLQPKLFSVAKSVFVFPGVLTNITLEWGATVGMQGLNVQRTVPSALFKQTGSGFLFFPNVFSGVGSRRSVVGIASRQQAGLAGFRSPDEERDFSLLQDVQIRSGATQAPIQ
jgi:hypothetical protein